MPYDPLSGRSFDRLVAGESSVGGFRGRWNGLAINDRAANYNDMLPDELLFEGGHVAHIALYYELMREARRKKVFFDRRSNRGRLNTAH